MNRSSLLALGVLASACARSATAPTTTTTTPTATPTTTTTQAAPTTWTGASVPLPQGTGDAFFDYIVYEPGRRRVWVPGARDVGSVDVFDIGSRSFTRVGGFGISEQENKGKKRTLGPSAVTIGDGVAYVGDRATSEVCVVDVTSLKVGACVKLPVPIDGVVYVTSTQEVWVTTPRDKSLAVLDASKPAAPTPKLVIKTNGEPEGYAYDDARGVFYTNLEDGDQTLVIDLKTHAVKATWSAGCGKEGPRGVAVDHARNFVIVACTDRVRVVDPTKGGALLSELATGAGVDNLDYLEAKKVLYVAAGKTAQLFALSLDDQGKLAVVAVGKSEARARNAVVDADGNAYVVDPKAPQLLVFTAPTK